MELKSATEKQLSMEEENLEVYVRVRPKLKGESLKAQAIAVNRNVNYFSELEHTHKNTKCRTNI